MYCRQKAGPLLNADADDVEYKEVLRASLNKKDPRHQHLATKAWFPHATRLNQFPMAKRVPTAHYTKYFLNDELVNGYFDMLADHYSTPELRLHSVSSHSLTEQGHAGLLRGIAKEGGIEQYDVVLCPLHNKDLSHWCLGVLDVKQRLVFVLDPLQVRVQAAPAIKHSFLSAAELSLQDSGIEACYSKSLRHVLLNKKQPKVIVGWKLMCRWDSMYFAYSF
jgi:Ulp1 protease family, C-terminal catalytic domain